MYTRNYYPEAGDPVNVPNNYDGTAFMDGAPVNAEPISEVRESTSIIQGSNESVLASLGRLPILSGIFGKDSSLSSLKLKMPSIGTEEILLIATAAFLFFSKSGDRESAILLLLLLLIN